MYRWCDAGIGGGGRGPGSISGARGLPCSSVVAVGAVLLWLLSLVPRCSIALLFGCTQGCWVLCVLLCLFPPPPCALCFSCRHRLFGALFVCSRSVLLVRARGPALRLGVSFAVFCCCLRRCTCSHYCVFCNTLLNLLSNITQIRNAHAHTINSSSSPHRA